MKMEKFLDTPPQEDINLLQSKKEEVIRLADKLIDGAFDIISKVIDTEEDQNNLRALLLLKHPVTGMEPTTAEITQFLCDNPGFILTVHYQYLHAKRQRERLLAELRPRAEHDLVEERMSLKAKGVPSSAFGQITKDDIRDKLHSFPEFSQLSNLEMEESVLEKMVSLLERRPYELGKILDVEIRATY